MDVEAWRFVVAVGMLAGAAVSDLRIRRVRDPYWLPFAGAAGAFLLYDVTRRPPGELAWAYGAAALLCALLYGLWWFGLFGGADAKGLMVVAVLVPWPRPGLVAIPPVVDALANGSLFVMAIPIAFLLWNAAHGRARFPAALLGVPMTLAAARKRHVWPMQVVRPEGGLRWRYWQRIGGDLESEYAALESAGLSEVWATPKVPFMVPLAAGLAVSWWHGNLVLQLAAWAA